jgi:hypothetical protein
MRRPKATNEAHRGLVFITKYGGSWAKDTRDNPIAAETRKLMRAVGITRKGLAFYGLRRTFETVAGETIDQVAVDFIMGHSPHVNVMASVYRQRITDLRLIAVTEPRRFNVEGAAIDSRGFACHELACPHCHLVIARPLFEPARRGGIDQLLTHGCSSCLAGVATFSPLPIDESEVP